MIRCYQNSSHGLVHVIRTHLLASSTGVGITRLILHRSLLISVMIVWTGNRLALHYGRFFGLVGERVLDDYCFHFEMKLGLCDRNRAVVCYYDESCTQYGSLRYGC